jgi:ribosomal protein L29
MSTYKDIQKKSDAELATMVQENREALRTARFGTAGAGTADVKKIREAKQDTARALTELNARKRSESNKKA